MEAIASLNTTAGQSIPSILPPTFKIFAPLLSSHASTIKSIPSREVSYGTHPRQKLDIYTPPSSSSSASSPILIFLHGGGLVRGDKSSPQMPGNLVYANVGAFFALRGFTTLVMNYRRVDSSAPGCQVGEHAQFPSGGEDVSEALKWVEKEFGGGEEGKRDVFLVGNSAGGVHASTFVLGEKFAEQRKSLVSGKGGVVLRGLVNVAVPCHFRRAEEGRSEVLKAYYGDTKEVEERCVFGLLEAVMKSGKSREEVGVPACLAVLGEFDPEDEICEPMEDFVKLWESWGDGIESLKAEGHNHISPPMALCSGDVKGEKWGEDVVAWIKKQS
ncbi:alpha/beta-hydrolase [Mollisia scopiformis]|uniref:Alpha/beta-hydrolase n=1 Tax=Mollisia scopiformis TaxID=149040 RepID=A0A194X5W2_MOLSC|nr:alpha/beta-hydrolase [Mollisia scopiformis]KUJ15464.1 alpha/beta-hydrolase [Mollisia scopiformis]